MYFGGGFAKSKKTGKIFNEQIFLDFFLKIFVFFSYFGRFFVKKDRVSVPRGI